MVYRSWFWGFVFLFDFRINGFDVLPDIVSYIFFLDGIHRMSRDEPRIPYMRWCSWLLLILSIPDIHWQWMPFSPYVAGSVYQLAVLILNTVLVYHICSVVKEKARFIGLSDIAEKAHLRWTLYLTLSVLMAFPLLSLAMMNLLGPALVFGLFAFSLVVYLLMLDLMKKAETYLD